MVRARERSSDGGPRPAAFALGIGRPSGVAVPTAAPNGRRGSAAAGWGKGERTQPRNGGGPPPFKLPAGAPAGRGG